jgi:hypothetical protein
MTERQAWELGEARAARLRGEAEAARQLRSAAGEGGRRGRPRRYVGALARTLAARLAGLADALDGRRTTISSP